MSKFFPAVLFSLVLCLPVTAFANLDQPLQALDDRALSAEYGQSNTLNLVQDQYRFTVQDLVNQVRAEQAADLANNFAALGSRFYINPQGQTVLQIQRDVVSLGVIETTLSVDGLRQLGQHFIDEFKALAFE
ncbi:hypothetical protein HX122_10905 [Acinetobacter towneri]|uniref:hypothetical protein n=1 Tax=Acinetobacter towneri TaxID=202956 RepID=UPI0025758AC2|nr:hypothetical protein [Acinetobacter towneri]MDM1755455.1 hypothetical protein [Acinetobacter towneri]